MAAQRQQRERSGEMEDNAVVYRYHKQFITCKIRYHEQFITCKSVTMNSLLPANPSIHEPRLYMMQILPYREPKLYMMLQRGHIEALMFPSLLSEDITSGRYDRIPK